MSLSDRKSVNVSLGNKFSVFSRTPLHFVTSQRPVSVIFKQIKDIFISYYEIHHFSPLSGGEIQPPKF